MANSSPSCHMPSPYGKLFPQFSAKCLLNFVLIFLSLTNPHITTATAANADDSDSNQNSYLPNMDTKSDSNQDSYLPNKEELEKQFNQFDVNRDGKMSMWELSDLLKAMGLSDSPSELQRIMNDIDSDKDEFISLHEFAHLCRPTSYPSQEKRGAFDMYDQDGNGLISSSELCLAFNRRGLKCSMDYCVNIIRSFDSDHDGNVNFMEFEKMTFDKLANGL